MKVLLSIKPEFALKIFDGTKKYEYRRTIFKKNVESVVVYASDPYKRVIGEFDIIEILHENLDELWDQTYSQCGIEKTLFNEYFDNQSDGYAIEIGKTRKYHTSLLLEDLEVSFPPQSFMYLNIDPFDFLYDPMKFYYLKSSSLPALTIL